MSNTPNENPRAGRVSRKPLIAVLIILIVVAVAGAILSQNRKGDITTAAQQATTTTSVAVDSGTSTTALALTTTMAPAGSTTSAPSTTAVPAGGTDCTADALRAAAVASGNVSADIADSVRVSDFSCVEPYARAELTSSAGDVKAYFVQANQAWRVLTLGSGRVSATDAGVPAEVASQLG